MFSVAGEEFAIEESIRDGEIEEVEGMNPGGFAGVSVNWDSVKIGTSCV